MTPERNRYPAVTQQRLTRALTTTSIAAGRLLAAGAEARITLHGPGHHLVGRQDRDAVLHLLSDRYASEHLDDDQYEERHTIAWQARTRRDLRTAVRGLSW